MRPECRRCCSFLLSPFLSLRPPLPCRHPSPAGARFDVRRPVGGAPKRRSRRRSAIHHPSVRRRPRPGPPRLPGDRAGPALAALPGLPAGPAAPVPLPGPRGGRRRRRRVGLGQRSLGVGRPRPALPGHRREGHPQGALRLRRRHAVAGERPRHRPRPRRQRRRPRRPRGREWERRRAGAVVSALGARGRGEAPRSEPRRRPRRGG